MRMRPPSRGVASVAAMQSALPSYGQAWAMGFALAAKSIGPQLIASKNRGAFPFLAAFFLIYGIGVSLLVGVGAVVPFHR